MQNKNVEFLKDFNPSYWKDYIPEYWHEHLQEKIDRITSLKKDLKEDCFQFGFISDIHWIDNNLHSAALLKKVLTDCDIPYYFDAGDIVSGYGFCEKESNLYEIEAVRKLFSDIEEKRLLAEGNHDSAYSTLEEPYCYAQDIPFKEFNEHYFAFLYKYKDRNFGPDGRYYYVDIKDKKTRLIVLNTHDIPDDSLMENGIPVYHKFRERGSGIMAEQLNWFSHTALDVPSSDWTVVLCTHESPAEYGFDEISNFELINGILNAFKNHTKYSGKTEYSEHLAHYNAKITVDYTNKGGNFAVWVSGHSHSDKYVTINDVLSVTTLNDSMHNSKNSPFLHIKTTTTEQAFDIFTIDFKNHKIYSTRIGCGEDRVFEYTTI